MLVLVPGVQLNHREEMLAARRRLQDQYNAQLKEAAKAKEDVSADVLLLRNSTVLFQYLHTVFCEPN
jgi:dTDP-4-amino-4,6-dideoxygalactose transaminase